MLLFRQMIDPQSSTYTYLLADAENRHAVLIDPVFEQARRDAALIDELGLTLTATLETHVHADHVTGAWLLKSRFGCRTCVAAAAGTDGADLPLVHGQRIGFGARWLEVRATPGHTNGCLSFVLDDRGRVFTGDCLLVRGCGRTDFQQGDARALYDSVHRELFTLPDDCLVYPGHDYRGLTVTSVGEERRFNPRLGGAIGVDDFVGYMAHLGLPHPKQMEVAVPANLRCGRPQDGATPGALAGWADWPGVTYTFAGIHEMPPDVLEEQMAHVQLIDVREPGEFEGPLGRIASARPVPLGELQARLDEIDRSAPVVVVCRSGARSAQACVLLQKAGFERVANLAGGMLRWRAQGLAAVGGQR